MSQDPESGWQRPDDEVRPSPAALDTQLGDLIAYCRGVTGREEDAVSTAHDVLNSARSLLTDPDRQRAWLFVLARMELVPTNPPPSQEVFDLLHRHGIRREDLPVVLGISPVEADELLATAEQEVGWDDRDGCWDDTTTYFNEGQPDLPAGESSGEMFETQLPAVVAYCRALTGQEDAAVSTAHTALNSARSLLSDPGRLRAWLFGLARQDMLGDAAPGGQEIIDLIHQHAVRAEDLPIVLGIPASDAAELLSAAEEEVALSAVSPEHHDADSADGEDRHPDRSWDDRAAGWDSIAAWDDDVGEPDRADWDEDFGPKTHRLQDVYGLFRKSAGSAGRHAKPGLGAATIRRALTLGPFRAFTFRRALDRGPVRAAAAAGIVVAVIGASTAYLAMANSSPPSQPSHQTKHRPPAVALFPAATPSPTPTATPTQRASQQVPVVLQQPTSAPRSTSPAATSAPPPSPSPEPSSTSPSPTPSPSPS